VTSATSSPGLPERTRLFRLFKTHRAWAERFLAEPTVNKLGLVVAWDCDTANVSDTVFQPLIKRYEAEMIVCSDTGFHAEEGETVPSMLTLVSHFKKVMHREWAYFRMRLGYTMAAFNMLVQWHGLEPDDEGVVRLSSAEFSL
jgi:hypothetical protein